MTSSKSKCTREGLDFGCDSGPCNQHKCGLFRRDARWRVFVTWQGWSIYYVHEHDFESSWLWDVNRGNSNISLAVFWLHLATSNLVCIRANILWKRWKITLKPRSYFYSKTFFREFIPGWFLIFDRAYCCQNRGSKMVGVIFGRDLASEKPQLHSRISSMFILSNDNNIITISQK